MAKHAGVNISSLYRRFDSKEELIRRLCSDGLQSYIEIAQTASDDEDGDPWEVFATFMRRIMEADNHALTVRLAGRFTPNKQNQREAARAFTLNAQLVTRAKAAGHLRDDIDASDLTYVFEQLSCLTAPTAQRTAELRSRYLALHLGALRALGEHLCPDRRRRPRRWRPAGGRLATPPPLFARASSRSPVVGRQEVRCQRKRLLPCASASTMR